MLREKPLERGVTVLSDSFGQMRRKLIVRKWKKQMVGTRRLELLTSTVSR
jgi:hypothetical protein